MKDSNKLQKAMLRLAHRGRPPQTELHLAHITSSTPAAPLVTGGIIHRRQKQIALIFSLRRGVVKAKSVE
jgi:hypothetical protein